VRGSEERMRILIYMKLVTMMSNERRGRYDEG
jgi:hypothetical protein